MAKDYFCLIERFANDCRKINNKVITPTNHNSRKQRDEAIRIPAITCYLLKGQEKITCTRCAWFWFCFSLLEKPGRHF